MQTKSFCFFLMSPSINLAPKIMCEGGRQREHSVRCRMVHTLLKFKFIHRHSVIRSLCENLLDFLANSMSFILLRSWRDMEKNQKIVDTEIALDVPFPPHLSLIYLFYSYISSSYSWVMGGSFIRPNYRIYNSKLLKCYHAERGRSLQI